MTKAAELAKMGEVLTNSQIGGRRNIVINGAMQISQRGTSETGVGGSSGYFTLDRYKIVASGTAGRVTMSQSTDAPNGFSNSLKLDCTTADTSIASGEYFFLSQYIEGQDVQQLKKGTSDAEKVTVSFYVKGNASATYTLELEDADNSRQNSQEFSVTTSWTRVVKTFVGDTTGTLNNDNGNSLNLNIILHSGSDLAGGTHTSNAWHSTANQRAGDNLTSIFDSTDREFFITGLQIEVGSQATPFEHRSFGEELALCQRYYFQKISGNGQPVGIGTYITSGQIRTYVDFPVEMRADPSIVTSSGTSHFNLESPSDSFDGGWVLVQVNKNSAVPYATGSVSGTTSYSGIIRSISADSRLAFNSEL
jgi:hypothetical protein